MSLPKLMRVWHRLGAVLVLLPAALTFGTGLLLLVKKEWAWVQPPTARSTAPSLELGWDEVLAAVARVPEAEVRSWEDVDRLDVRPGRGIIKVRCRNRWEVQLDAKDGDVLGSAYRRSDLIESLHDGSWFHPWAKLGVWLPAGLLLVGLWGTGLYLWWLPHAVRRRRRA